jgi:hypothetical protein
MARPEHLSWRTHPFRRRRLRGAAGLAVACASLVLVQLWARSPWLTLLGGALLTSSLWAFYVPMRYRLDGGGITVDYGPWRRRWPWTRFQVFVPGEGGFFLSPFARPHRLERYRGLFLPCEENRDAVRGWLAARLPARSGTEGAA